jgi:hypothetical protein
MKRQPSRFRRVAAFCSAPDYRRDRSPRFELARVLVRFDHYKKAARFGKSRGFYSSLS